MHLLCKYTACCVTDFAPAKSSVLIVSSDIRYETFGDMTDVRQRAFALQIPCLPRDLLAPPRGSELDFSQFGGDSESKTPGPIPNPEVKCLSANGTAA